MGSLGIFVAYSFYRTVNYDFVPSWNLDNYATAIGSPVYRALLLRTLGLGLAVTVIVVITSFLFVYLANFVFPRRRPLLFFLVLVSLFGGYLVRIYAWRTILGAEGVINQSLIAMGLIHEPLRFLLNGWFAVVAALVNFLIPIGVLPIDAAMQNVSPKLVEAARDLGSNQFQAAVRVVLPLVMRGVTVAFAFCLIGAAGDYLTPALLGGTEATMIGNAVVTEFGTDFNWPLGSALSFTLMISVLAVVAFVIPLLRRAAAR